MHRDRIRISGSLCRSLCSLCLCGCSFWGFSLCDLLSCASAGGLLTMQADLFMEQFHETGRPAAQMNYSRRHAIRFKADGEIDGAPRAGGNFFKVAAFKSSDG